MALYSSTNHMQATIIKGSRFRELDILMGIWHFNGSQSQIPHPQAPTKC